MRCTLLLRDSPHYRREAFATGMQALGYSTLDRPPSTIRSTDVLICWNRSPPIDNVAIRFLSAGARVLVAENCYLGNDWLGDEWLSISRDHHNGAGYWPQDEGQRWGSFGYELECYRPSRMTGEIILLPQRNIGPVGVAMPRDWEQRVKAMRIPPYRRRDHPGTTLVRPLLDDLKDARCVITWGSGAAIKALAAGIPCISTWDKWIGAKACTPLTRDTPWGSIPQPDRLPMFKRLAGAIWRVSEIRSGYALEELLKCKPRTTIS